LAAGLKAGYRAETSRSSPAPSFQIFYKVYLSLFYFWGWAKAGVTGLL
jgi:hypothetical protein